MTMDKSAIELIQQTAHIPEVMKELSAKNTQIPIVAVPDSMRICDLEKYMANAARYRLGYDTSSFKDFTEYCIKHDQDGATCFVNPDSMSANTIFDIGTGTLPGHKEHNAKLTLKKTAAYTAICHISQKPLDQKIASEFIEDWVDLITGVKNTGGENMSAPQAAAALRDLTVETAKEINSKVHDFGESLSGFERIEAKNQSNIPAVISFACEPFRALQTRTFSLRVGLLTGEDKPKVVFRIQQLEATEEAIADEFKDKLCASFESLKLVTFIGQASS